MTQYIVSDGVATIRTFNDSDNMDEAQIFWMYNDCRGAFYSVHASTGIIIDKLVSIQLTSTSIGTYNHLWRSGRITQSTHTDGSLFAIVYSMLGRTAPTMTASAPVYVDHFNDLRAPSSTTTTTAPPPSSSSTPSPTTVDDGAVAIAEQVARLSLSTDETTADTVSTTVSALQAEVQRLKTYIQQYVHVSEDVVQSQYTELQQRLLVESKERQRLEKERQRLQREIECDEEARRKFDSGKFTFRIFRREILEGKRKPGDIPIAFKTNYQAYQQLLDMGMLDLPNDWDQYQNILDAIKDREFDRDRAQYVAQRQNTTGGPPVTADTTANQLHAYNVFRVMDDRGMLYDDDAYETFIELMAEYMRGVSESKYGLDRDVGYLDDIDLDHRGRATASEDCEESKSDTES